MSGSVVLDASAAVRAVLDPAGQPVLLDRIGDAALVLAPTLLVAEVGNALWKYQRARQIGADELVARHREAMALVHRIVNDAELFPEVLMLAADAGHPVYDAIYAVTARRHAAVLVTFDRRLHEFCGRVGIHSELLAA
ncbi:MAG: type II toxin-antitoxin system VapC family toxin [Burkholderiaceae bacterium]